MKPFGSGSNSRATESIPFSIRGGAIHRVLPPRVGLAIVGLAIGGLRHALLDRILLRIARRDPVLPFVGLLRVVLPVALPDRVFRLGTRPGCIFLLIALLDRIFLLVPWRGRIVLPVARRVRVRLLIRWLRFVWPIFVRLRSGRPCHRAPLIRLQLEGLTLRRGLGGAAGDQRRGLAGEHDPGVGQSLLLDQREQGGGVIRREAHATVRRRRAEALGFIRTMDGMALGGKEDGMRHGRVVPFLRKVILFQAERGVAAGGGGVTGAPGGNRPRVALDAINRDGHLLQALVDADDDTGRRTGRKQHRRRQCRKKSAPRTHDATHRWRKAPPRMAKTSYAAVGSPLCRSP